MPFAKIHNYLTLGGPITGGQDRWQFGLRFADTVPGPPTTQAQVEACEAPVRAWYSSVNSNFAAGSSLDMIKLAQIGVDGKYPAGTDAVEAVISPTISGASSTAATWPQLSFVVSLTTLLPRGRGHIGRVYLPPCSHAIAPNGSKIPTATVDAWLGTFRTMVLALNAIGFGQLSVMGKTGSGTEQIVTGFRGGVVMDTQRRRRRQIPDTYQLLAL